MATASNNNKPPLAALVQAGEQQTEAIPISDGIFMAKDISNAYLVTTAAGDVLVNAGFMASAERNKSVFSAVRTGPLKNIILTQGHADHYGGVPDLKEESTQIIAERRFTETCAFFTRLMPYLGRRSARLWSGTIKRGNNPVPTIVPDIEVDECYDFELGERRFELISTPGGESLDSLVVWMPNERVLFSGNLFGPVFMSVPNLCTLRGDKPRSAQRFLDSLNKVRQLGAKTLITGHGDPITGAATIRENLDKLHAGVSYLLEATLDGMNQGKDVHSLMRDITLPTSLKLGEFHGKVAWAVRSIWEEHSGWFHHHSSTELYAIPRSSVDVDIVEMAGGVTAITNKAQEKLKANEPLQAMHLLDIALGAQADSISALNVKKMVLEHLQKISGAQNLSETMWLKTELANVSAKLKEK